MFVYQPDVLTLTETQEYNKKRGRAALAVFSEQDYQILFARHGLIFTGVWETYMRQLPYDYIPELYAEVYPL